MTEILFLCPFDKSNRLFFFGHRSGDKGPRVIYSFDEVAGYESDADDVMVTQSVGGIGRAVVGAAVAGPSVRSWALPPPKVRPGRDAARKMSLSALSSSGRAGPSGPEVPRRHHGVSEGMHLWEGKGRATDNGSWKCCG